MLQEGNPDDPEDQQAKKAESPVAKPTKEREKFHIDNDEAEQ